MIPKAIVYSDHARERLRLRRIRRPQVRWLLAHGIREGEGENTTLRGRVMRLRYDNRVDALAVDFRVAATSARSVRVDRGIIADFDTAGRLVSLEVLNASRHVPRAELERLPAASEVLTLAQAAKESGLAPTTLRNQLNNDRLKGEKRGRDWFVDATDLLNYLESRAPQGRPARKRKGRRQRPKNVAHSPPADR